MWLFRKRDRKPELTRPEVEFIASELTDKLLELDVYQVYELTPREKLYFGFTKVRRTRIPMPGGGFYKFI